MRVFDHNISERKHFQNNKFALLQLEHKKITTFFQGFLDQSRQFTYKLHYLLKLISANKNMNPIITKMVLCMIFCSQNSLFFKLSLATTTAANTQNHQRNISTQVTSNQNRALCPTRAQCVQVTLSEAPIRSKQSKECERGAFASGVLTLSPGTHPPG